MESPRPMTSKAFRPSSNRQPTRPRQVARSRKRVPGSVRRARHIQSMSKAGLKLRSPRRLHGPQRGWLAGMAGLSLCVTFAGIASSEAASEPASAGGPATFRRLNEAQYTRAMEDVFGSGIKIPGRFEPPMREEGLLAIGDGKVVVSASGFEQYDLRARQISAQVLPDNR